MPASPYDPNSMMQQIQQRLQGFKGPVQQTDLRFDPYFAEQFRNLDRGMVNQQTQAQSMLNQLSQGRAQGIDQQERMADAARRALTQRMSDQGILRSGINIGARSDLNQQNIEAMNALNQQYAQGVGGVNQNLFAYMNDLGAQRESLRMAQARAETAARQQEEMQRGQSRSGLEYILALLQQMNGGLGQFAPVGR